MTNIQISHGSVSVQGTSIALHLGFSQSSRKLKDFSGLVWQHFCKNYLGFVSIMRYSGIVSSMATVLAKRKIKIPASLLLTLIYEPPELQSRLMFIHITLFSGKVQVHFCAMASSPLGRMRVKCIPPTPVNPRPTMGSRAVSSLLADEAWTLAEAVDPPSPGRISGSDSLAGVTDPGLVAEGEVVLAVRGLVGVLGLARPRLARASSVPSGSTMTLITEKERGR